MTAPWVAFYSVRGGVGRSTSLALVALELARRGRRVAAVDFDLESPGLDVLLTHDNAGSRERGQRGVVDFLDARARGEAFGVEEIVIPLELPGDYTGRLFLVPAGRCDDRYLEALDRLDLKQMYERSGLLNPVRQLRVELEEVLEPDVVLIDSRTGYSDAALVTLFDLADAAVIVMVPDLQNVERLAPVLQRLVQGERKPQLLLVANKCQVTPPAWRAVAHVEARLHELVPVAEEEVDEVESPFLYKLPFLSEFTWVQRMLPPPVPSDALRQLATRVDALIQERAHPAVQTPKTSLSREGLVLRQELLERLRFGTPRAEHDDRLLDAFVPTRNVREALRPERWLVRGARGAGRTALFRFLTERPFEAREYCPVLAGWRPISAYGVGWTLSYQRGRSFYFMRRAEEAVRESEATWEDFWRMHAVMQAVHSLPMLATTDLRREVVSISDDELFNDQKYLHKLLSRGAGVWMEEFKSLAPKEGSPGLMFVYDDVDNLGEEGIFGWTDSRAFRGLINIWIADEMLALRDRMVPKIFMREDFFKTLSSEEFIRAWRLHDAQLRWEPGEIATCVVKRARADARIRDYMEEHEGTLSHLPTGETKGFAVLFDERIGVGEKRARTWQMAIRRLVDADGRLVPSDFVHMAGVAQKLEKQDPSGKRSFEPALISGAHVFEAIADTSRVRASSIEWMLPRVDGERVSLEGLRGLQSPFLEAEFLSRLVAGQPSGRPQQKRQEWAQRILLRMKRLGVIGEWADGRLFVADLYLQGFGMHRAGLKGPHTEASSAADLDSE